MIVYPYRMIHGHGPMFFCTSSIFLVLMKVANPTMGKSPPPAGKTPYPLKPAIGAFKALPLGKGFAALPDLIDVDSIEKSTLQLR